MTKPRLKPIDEQVMVITGASSGIGLATAREAASQGAKVFLISRNGEALQRACAEINEDGGRAEHAVADVAQEHELRRAAEQAIERFGRIDTWVNNAGVSIYGEITQVPADEHRRLFETNYFGVVNGCRVALEHMQRDGGAILNIGSVLSDRAIPIQGAYSASKHAVKGFTDALRMEVEHAGHPVSVTLIKPSAIDTPYTEHAKNYLSNHPKNPPPVYAPRVVAQAIIHCAQHPMRDLTVGGGGKMITTLGTMFPRWADRVMRRVMVPMQESDREARPRDEHALYESRASCRESGDSPQHVCNSSVYTRAAEHPVLTSLIVAGTGLVVATLLTGAGAAAVASSPKARDATRRAGRGLFHRVRDVACTGNGRHHDGWW